VRLDHAIFQGPLSVEVKFDKSDPWEPEADPRGMWTVQTGKMGTENDYGVVSDGIGFEDSPDCEWISGGENSKGPHAVAIGRQANMLQWGFYCAPDRMTPSARRAFLNAIVYMKRFDGRRPLVKKVTRGREWYGQFLGYVRELDGKYKNAGKGFREYLESCFPKDVVEKHGLDADALGKWYEENREFIRSPGRWQLEVDADLKELGLSNRKPEFLDWIVEKLAANAQDELAKKLAARYLGPDVADPVAYIRKNREKLFFSDIGGFRWFVDTRGG